MRLKNIALGFFLSGIIAFLYVQAPLLAQQRPSIVVVANSIDYELASDFFGFIGNNGMEVVHADSETFNQYKGEKFIVILGGPDAYNGVGEIVQGILSNDEQEYLRMPGNRHMFKKTNVFSQGQVVFIIAGSDRQQTKFAHVETRDRLYNDVEESSEITLTPTLESKKSLNPILVWNFTLPRHLLNADIRDVLITSDESYVAINYDSNEAFVLDLEGNKLWEGINRGDARNTMFAFSGKLVASEQSLNDVIGIFLEKGDIVRIADDGSFVVVSERYIRPFTNQGAIIAIYKSTNFPVSAAITREGNYLAVSSLGKGNLNLYNISLKGVDLIWSVGPSPSGLLGNILGFEYYFAKMTDEPNYIVTVDIDGWVVLYDIDGNVRWNYNIGALLTGVDISPDGSCIGVTTDKQRYYLLDSNGELISSPLLQGNLNVISVSNECKHIAVGADDTVYHYVT